MLTSCTTNDGHRVTVDLDPEEGSVKITSIMENDSKMTFSASGLSDGAIEDFVHYVEKVYVGNGNVLATYRKLF